MAHQGSARRMLCAHIEQGFQPSGGAVEKEGLDGGILCEHAIQITWFAPCCRTLLRLQLRLLQMVPEFSRAQRIGHRFHLFEVSLSISVGIWIVCTRVEELDFLQIRQAVSV